MNGGFALKLACNVDAAISALREVAAAEGFTMKPLRSPHPPDSDIDHWIALGVGARGKETVIALPLATDNDDILAGLAEALVARLDVAACVVVDSDAGCERLRAWRGGDRLSPETGLFAWDHDGNTCFALAAPRLAVVAATEARAIVQTISIALPATVRELGARIVEVARREPVGPFANALAAWRFALDVPDHARVHVYVSATPDTDLAALAAREIALRLDESRPLAARWFPAGDELAAAVAARIPAELLGLERRGFALVHWSARVRFDGAGATLEVAVPGPPDDADAELDELVSALVGAIAGERRERQLATQQSLDEVLGDQLQRGDLDAAAATYRELHAAYFGTLPEDRAIAASLAKVHELRKLYGTK
jgi:hypothetical protein